MDEWGRLGSGADSSKARHRGVCGWLHCWREGGSGEGGGRWRPAAAAAFVRRKESRMARVFGEEAKYRKKDLGTLAPVLRNKRSHRDEKPAHSN